MARIRPDQDGTDATAAQVRRLAGLLPPQSPVPVFVFDAGYDAAALTYELADARAQIVVRIRDDRVFYADPPEQLPG